MHLQTIVLAILIIGFGGAQYALMAQAIRDLLRRPRVRGGNKVAWGLVILCVPVAGALFYGWMGPTSFIRRASTVPEATLTDGEAPTGAQSESLVPTAGLSSPARFSQRTRRNITPIGSGRVASVPRTPQSRSAANPVRIRRTGS